MPLFATLSPEQLTALRERILARFNLEELRLLVADLGENYDDLRGETISGKIQALLEHLNRRDRLPDLIARLQELRPVEEWANVLPAEPNATSPYKGLLYFDEADAPIFFGREQVTAELLAHLRQHCFLAVVGASGSGKSSVVRAGVIPAVRRGEIAGEQGSSANWPVHLITPGDEPLKALAATLTRDSESVTATKTLLADLQTDTDSLDLFLYRQMGAGAGRCLLIIDQFEELFTQCRDAAAREMFVGNLVTAVSSGQQARLSLILTLRADFYAQAVQLEALRPLLETRQKIIGAMTPDELRQAIEGPADKGNWALQPGLVETMLQDVGREPGALPLLSHALQETWARREGRTLTLAGYQAAGGVRKAIAQTADAVYASLTPEQQSLARNIFLRLTELGEGTEDTRRRVALAELLPEGEGETAVFDLLDLLARRRLVTLNTETAHAHAEVAHEALIREWPALRSWLDENRERLRLQRQITEAAQAWQASREDASYLYRGGRLAQAQEWTAQPGAQLNPLERRFLTTSKEHEVNEQARITAIAIERTRASRFLNVALFVANIFAIAFLIILLQNRANLATAVAQTRIAQSQALASASLVVQESDLMRGLLLAVAAGQSDDTPLAYDALYGAVPRAALPRHTWQHDGPINGSVWNTDTSHILTWSDDGTVRVWDVTSGAEMLRLNHDHEVKGANWNRDESEILTWGNNNTVLIWDTATGTELLRLRHDRWVRGAAWNRDESLILTWSDDGTGRVWEAASGTEQLRLSRDTQVWGAAWNGDENLILTWGCDGIGGLVCNPGMARVWDATNGVEQLRLIHDLWVSKATWNSSENRILTLSGDYTARIWEATSGVELLRLSHNSWIHGATWNKDESLILTWSDDGTARIWNAVSGVELLRLSHKSQIHGATWNKDESLILTWSADGMARVWDTASGIELLRLSHRRTVSGAAWNRDESLLLSISDDGTVRVWDAASGAERLRLHHDDSVWGAAWNRDESLISTWSWDNTARVWDAFSGTEQLRLSHESSVSGAAWNRDESMILLWNNERTAQVFDTTSGAERLRFSHDSLVSNPTWNKHANLILTWSDDSVRVWDATNGTERLSLSHDFLVQGAIWNRDESQILTWSDDGTVRVWDVASGAERLRLKHDHRVNGAVWNEDENLVLTWHDNMVRVWDTTSGVEQLRLSHDVQVSNATWNKDANLILTLCGGTVRVWNAANGAELLRLSHDDTVWGAVWNRDESQILTWSGNGTVRVWDVASGGERLRLSHDDIAWGASWNGDESLILTWSNDGTARIWNATTGAERLRLYHDEWVNGATWNGDESLILTWSWDGTARVWNAATGQAILTLTGDGTPVIVAQWSQDGRQILLVTQGGFAGSFATLMADLLDAACQRATRNFNWTEWQLYFPDQPYRLICDQWPVHDSVPEGERPTP